MNREQRRAAERDRRRRVQVIREHMLMCPACHGVDPGCVTCHGHGVVDRPAPGLSK